MEDPPKSPLKRGTYIPPFLRGARGDQAYPSSIENRAKYSSDQDGRTTSIPQKMPRRYDNLALCRT